MINADGNVLMNITTTMCVNTACKTIQGQGKHMKRGVTVNDIDSMRINTLLQSVQLILDQLPRSRSVVDDMTSPPPWVCGSDQIGCRDGFWVDKTVF